MLHLIWEDKRRKTGKKWMWKTLERRQKYWRILSQRIKDELDLLQVQEGTINCGQVAKCTMYCILIYIYLWGLMQELYASKIKSQEQKNITPAKLFFTVIYPLLNFEVDLLRHFIIIQLRLLYTMINNAWKKSNFLGFVWILRLRQRPCFPQRVQFSNL